MNDLEYLHDLERQIEDSNVYFVFSFEDDHILYKLDVNVVVIGDYIQYHGIMVGLNKARELVQRAIANCETRITKQVKARLKS